MRACAFGSGGGVCVWGWGWGWAVPVGQQGCSAALHTPGPRSKGLCAPGPANTRPCAPASCPCEQDVRSDPTLPRTKDVRCPMCSHNEAVFFTSSTEQGGRGVGGGAGLGSGAGKQCRRDASGVGGLPSERQVGRWTLDPCSCALTRQLACHAHAAVMPAAVRQRHCSRYLSMPQASPPLTASAALLSFPGMELFFSCLSCGHRWRDYV